MKRKKLYNSTKKATIPTTPQAEIKRWLRKHSIIDETIVGCVFRDLKDGGTGEVRMDDFKSIVEQLNLGEIFNQYPVEKVFAVWEKSS